ncbi:hypothetical protein B296_00011751 [Ensete ventricosum]|uniref:Uncharacterized protein n=1 Tax=Ensete ventricosum TaxID=4639 RepID=A0A426YZK4_ENSVE|nr:hypothetical protein B296_00011751 [Ensete ventricosum]
MHLLDCDSSPIQSPLHPSRSAKGLCWHCDEPWRCDHDCKKGQLLLIEPVDESEQEEEDPEHEENTKEDLQLGDSMVRALVGYMNPQTIKIRGFLKQ